MKERKQFTHNPSTRTIFKFDSKDLDKMTQHQKREALNDLEEVKELLKFSIKLEKFKTFI
tara:strand:- start:2111 stop:2290 length:180 start_codon:yes stop_codon:yes gene_type:complete